MTHSLPSFFAFFFFNDTATTEIYTLSLHDALPISSKKPSVYSDTKWFHSLTRCRSSSLRRKRGSPNSKRSEEHTSELQSQSNLVCRLLLEKKKRYRTCPAR